MSAALGVESEIPDGYTKCYICNQVIPQLGFYDVQETYAGWLPVTGEEEPKHGDLHGSWRCYVFDCRHCGMLIAYNFMGDVEEAPYVIGPRFKWLPGKQPPEAEIEQMKKAAQEMRKVEQTRRDRMKN